MTYDAALTLKGLLRALDPLLGLAFKRVGDRAAAGLRAAIARIARWTGNACQRRPLVRRGTRRSLTSAESGASAARRCTAGGGGSSDSPSSSAVSRAIRSQQRT